MLRELIGEALSRILHKYIVSFSPASYNATKRILEERRRFNAKYKEKEGTKLLLVPYYLAGAGILFFTLFSGIGIIFLAGHYFSGLLKMTIAIQPVFTPELVLFYLVLLLACYFSFNNLMKRIYEPR